MERRDDVPSLEAMLPAIRWLHERGPAGRAALHALAGATGSPSRKGPRTSLGNGVVKPLCGRIAWAQLLRRITLVDVLACPCGGRRAIVSDISEREVVVIILAHLERPTFAPPIARARSPAFEFA